MHGATSTITSVRTRGLETSFRPIAIALQVGRCHRSLPEIAYDGSCLVRKVTRDGRISFMNRQLFVGNAFAGQPVGLKPTDRDGVLTVMFCSYRVGVLDLNTNMDIDP